MSECYFHNLEKLKHSWNPPFKVFGKRGIGVQIFGPKKITLFSVTFL